MGLTATLVEFFLVGLATPLSAACVLPLYPGFLVYLSNQSVGEGGATGEEATRPDPGQGSGETPDGRGEREGYSPALLGVLVVAGVVGFMLSVGLVFSYVLQRSLTVVVGTVSPVAFGLLAVVSVVLLLDLSVFSKVPTLDPPQHRHPTVTALAYGFFFGAIVIPCNPGLIAYFLARSFLQADPAGRLASFLAFGLGMGAPLLGLALVSESVGQRLTRAMARHRTVINRGSGAIMLGISVYYLLKVFDVFGVGSALGV